MAIPGFTPRNATLQDHIHLGFVPYTGSPVMGTYGEPPYKMKVVRRLPVPSGIGMLQRSWSGAPAAHILKDDNHKAVIFRDIRYALFIDDEDYVILEQLYKNKIYLVDVWHCAATSDHSLYVKQMFFDDMTYDDHSGPVISEKVNNVTIFLRDMYAVASI